MLQEEEMALVLAALDDKATERDKDVLVAWVEETLHNAAILSLIVNRFVDVSIVDGEVSFTANDKGIDYIDNFKAGLH